MLPNTTEDAALKVAESIRLTVRALGIPNTASSRGYITISAGVAARNRSTLDEATLVGEADTALYEGKRLGRNRSIVYSSLDLRYVESASIQHDGEFAPGNRRIKRAVSNDGLPINYLADRPARIHPRHSPLSIKRAPAHGGSKHRYLTDALSPRYHNHRQQN